MSKEDDNGMGFIALIVLSVIAYGAYHFWLYKPINVYEMKESTLKYDRSITLGAAVKQYKYFSSAEWSSEKDEYDRDIVTLFAVFKDSSLKPETAQQYKVGYLLKMAKNKTNDSATFISEEIVYSPVANPSDITRYPDADHLVLQAVYGQVNPGL